MNVDARTITLRPERSKNNEARILKLRGELLAIVARAAARRDLGVVFHRGGS